jgi:anti-sigma factor RsiW
MTQKFDCGDHEALVTYLYDECEPTERNAIEAHLGICPACAAEIAALGSTRLQLAAWTPPEAESDLGFRIVSEPRPGPVLRPAKWWQQPMPAWAQAAAAAVIFGVGLSLGGFMNLRIAPAPAPASTASAPLASSAAITPVSTDAVSRDDLTALEGRLRTEMAQLRTARASAPVASSNGSDAQLLARVRALIDESEQRQRRELALRTAEVVRDADAQRQFDLVRIQRAFGQFEGTAGAEIQRQRQDLNNLIRVSQRPQ